MKNQSVSQKLVRLALCTTVFITVAACNPDDNQTPTDGNAAILLVIDEDSIDNGNPPNNFSATDVNDQIADVGLRLPLQYFRDNIGKTIDLYTGQVGDEGWFAIKTIPNTWKSAGPLGNGALNYLAAGPGLGAPVPDDDREVLLDKIPNVTPLRATGLTMLIGKTVLAVVYDSDVSINYSPLQGNLMGANLGLVAFEVLHVQKRTDGSSSSLPRVSIRILGVEDVRDRQIVLFSNAPVPQSSSEPFDINPPGVAPDAVLVPAP